MLMLFFIVVAHWLACIWYVIAEKERLRNDKDWDLGKSLRATSALFLQVTPYSATRSGTFTGNARRRVHESS